MKKSHLLLLIAMNIAWGGTYGATKSLMQHAPFFLATTLRYAFAAAPLLAYVASRFGLRMRRGDLLRCALIGVATFTLAPALMYTGVGRGRAADGAILTAGEPLLISLGAYFYLRERVHLRMRVALAIAFFGAVLLSEFWRVQDATRPLSVALIAIAVGFEAVYSVLGKDVLLRQPPLKLAAVALACGTVVNLTIVAVAGWFPAVADLTGRDWFTLVAYLSLLNTIVGYSVWSWSLRDNAAANIAITIYVQPVGGFVLSWLWVKETPSPFQLLGAALVVAAVAISGRRSAPVQRRNFLAAIP